MTSEATQDEVLFTNIKRTYDEYQDLGLKAARDAQSAADTRQNIINQALQNAVESANMVAKQAIQHRDISVNHQWNLEPSEAAAQAQVLPGVYLDAIKAAVAAAVIDALGTRDES
jgi:hypothetical protein